MGVRPSGDPRPRLHERWSVAGSGVCYVPPPHGWGGDVLEVESGEAEAFDTAIRAALRETVAEGAVAERDGRLELAVTAAVVWGEPLTPGR